MPFTPFHMGPGLLVKSLLQGSFSLMVFGWTQIVMDIQPLLSMTSGIVELHGFTHTYIGATFIAVFAAATGKYVSQWALGLFLDSTPVVIRWWVAFLSAFFGAYSHVVLDSIMHADMQPLAPFSNSNALLHIISVSALHKFCVYSALAGAVLYLLMSKVLAKQNDVFKAGQAKYTRR